MDDLILPQGRYPESFMLISLLEVCQEGGPSWGYFEYVEGFLARDLVNSSSMINPIMRKGNNNGVL